MKKKVEYNPCPEIPYFGAQYPDARCIDGQLHDMDRCDEKGRLYVMNEYHPCPFCKTEEFIKEQVDNGGKKKDIQKWIEKMKQEYN